MPSPVVAAPLSVGVLVTLARGPGAGGHVKCWERFAEAAARRTDGTLDLTIHTMADAGAPARERLETLAPHVRFKAVPALLGTAFMPGLHQGAGHTDLAPFHPTLAQSLKVHDVLHTTDIFAFARTARRVSRRHRCALVASIHTDLPTLTELYAREILGRVTGHGWLGQRVLDDLALPRRLGQRAGRAVARHLRACDRVLVSSRADQVVAEAVVGAGRVSWLRRGIDLDRFHPRQRDRTRLRLDFGIPADRPLLLFVGRTDDSKRVMTLARAARRLLDLGHSLHVLVVGEGARRQDMLDLLGTDVVTAPGALPQASLPTVYASADVFVFPSESEVSPNVVLEARASGLPVVLSARDGGARFVRTRNSDGVLVDDPDPEAWASVLAPLLTDAAGRALMGRRARAIVEATVPDWDTVLDRDLLPVWRAEAGAVHARAPA